MRLCLRRLRVRLRVRRRRAVSTPELPGRDVSARLSADLAPMRARLLRRVGVAHRGPVLDLGAGWGFTTEELTRRAKGPVAALDRHPEALAALGPRAVRGDARRIPFERGHFDLVLCQQVLMWQAELGEVLSEIRRVLRPNGALVALEPDFGAMMEHPAEVAVADVWRAALSRAGADPLTGRKLPGALRAVGFEVRVDLSPAAGAADADRFDALYGLPLTDRERAHVAAAERAQQRLGAGACFAHLPFVCVTAARGTAAP